MRSKTSPFPLRRHTHSAGLVLGAVSSLQPGRRLSGLPHGSLAAPCAVLGAGVGHDLRQSESARGHHVLPHALGEARPLRPAAQPELPLALPHRPGPVRLAHLPGPAAEDAGGHAHQLVQDPEAVLLQGTLGAVRHALGPGRAEQPGLGPRAQSRAGAPAGTAGEVAVGDGGSVGLRSGWRAGGQDGAQVQATVQPAVKDRRLGEFQRAEALHAFRHETERESLRIERHGPPPQPCLRCPVFLFISTFLICCF